MAVHDYFIYILPNGVQPITTADHANGFIGQSVFNRTDLLTALKATLKSVSPYVRGESVGYLVDENLIVTPVEVGGKVREILIQGSLSWFEEGLEVVFDIGQALNQKGHVRFFRPKTDYVDMRSKERFISTIMSLNGDRLTQFQQKYGSDKMKIDPDKFFKARHGQLGWKKFLPFLK